MEDIYIENIGMVNLLMDIIFLEYKSYLLDLRLKMEGLKFQGPHYIICMRCNTVNVDQ